MLFYIYSILVVRLWPGREEPPPLSIDAKRTYSAAHRGMTVIKPTHQQKSTTPCWPGYEDSGYCTFA